MASVTGAAPSQPADPADPADPGLSRIARGGAFNLFGAVLAAVLTFAFAVVVTHAVDRDQAGVFFALTSAFVIAGTIARLGVPTGLVFFIAGYRATGDQARLRGVIRQALVPVTVLGVVLGAAGLLLAPQLSSALVGHRDGGTVALVRLLSACVLFSALTDVGVGATRGFGVMRPLVLVDRIARPLAQLVLAGLAVGLGARTAFGMGLAWAVPFVPSAVVLLWWARRLRTKAERRSATPAAKDRAGRSEATTFWRFTAPRSLGSIAQMALQRSDIVLLGVLRGPRDAAVYAAATRFLVFGQLVSGAIATTIQPRIAHLLAQRDQAGAGTVYRVATMWLVLLTWPIYLLSAVFGEQLLHVFGRATWTMANSFVALAVNIGLNLLLIPRWGILGAALAWAVAIVVNNLAPLTQLAASMRLHPFGRFSTLAVLLTGVCFGVLPLLTRLVGGGSLRATLIGTGIGALLYLDCLWRG
ncbi:MAG: oligosaccharide flippase family protein, partial [Actinobacteria bacterium]|nr:oligosaccharide flippase family protein [Actinomycetota bacterium]